MSPASKPIPIEALSARPDEANFDLDLYPFYWMAQVDALYSGQMEIVLRKIGVSRPQWRVLMGLHQQTPRSMSELASLSTMKLSTISRVVERMRADGLVSCKPREEDNRVTEVHLEPAGEAALSEIVRVAGLQYERAMQGLTQADINRLRKLLRQIHDNLNRSPLS